MEETFPPKEILQCHYNISLFPSLLSQVCLWPAARWCYSCYIFCSSWRSVLFVVIMCIDADHSYSLFLGLSPTQSCPCALTLYRVFGWKPKQSLVIVYSHCGAHSSTCCLCAVHANTCPTLLNFAVARFLQLNAEEKRETQSLWKATVVSCRQQNLTVAL